MIYLVYVSGVADLAGNFAEDDFFLFRTFDDEPLGCAGEAGARLRSVALGVRPRDWRGRRTTERNAMLRIYDTSLDVIRMLRPIVVMLSGRDRDLGDQLRRAASSVAAIMLDGSALS